MRTDSNEILRRIKFRISIPKRKHHQINIITVSQNHNHWNPGELTLCECLISHHNIVTSMDCFYRNSKPKENQEQHLPMFTK